MSKIELLDVKWKHSPVEKYSYEEFLTHMRQQKSLAKERILQFQTLDCSNVRSRRRETNVDSQLSGS